MKALILPKGVEIVPDTLNGVRGRQRGSYGGYWSPEKVKYPSGGYVHAWYSHFYKTEREHYHTDHDELEKCQELYP